MSKYFHPVDAVGSAAVAAVPQPLPVLQNKPASADAPLPPSDAPPSAAAGPPTVPTTDNELQRQLQAALKNTSFKAEITTESGGFTILKIVQSESGQIILQMPTKTALAIVAGLDKATADSSGDPLLPIGTVFSELA